MGQGPTLQGLKLEACCKTELQDIADRIKLYKLLKAISATGPFIVMLGANPLDIAFSVATTDWDLLVKSTNKLDEIVKKRCNSIALLHSFEHPGGPLNRFWIAMADVFA